MTRVTAREKLTVRCPTCEAAPEFWCYAMRGHGHTEKLHRERREAFLRGLRFVRNAWKRAEWMCNHPHVCPCQSELDDPGEHIATCRWNDPNYDEGGPL